MKFAIIENSVVVNIVLALEPQAENWIQSDTASIGDTYDGANFTKPEATSAEPTAPDERLWWVDVGPFIDRLGSDGPAIGGSTHEACKGVMAMLTGRKYIDLKDPKTAMMLDILIAAQQPAASVFFPGSGPMTTAKKAAILNTPTTDKERHIKGLT